MIYLSYTYVDAQTGVSVVIEPARNGPAMPMIDGLTFEFALESRYPSHIPIFYGTCPEGSDVSTGGVLEVLTDEQFQTARQDEQAALKRILIRNMTEAVQRHMDSAAAERNYDGIQTAALRAALPSSPFHAEGVAYGEWMDACWSHCYQVMADVESGAREQPTTDELIAELPELVLPS